MLSKIADACSDICSQPSVEVKLCTLALKTHAHLVASADAVLVPLLSLLHMVAAYVKDDGNFDKEHQDNVDGLCQEACKLCSRLYFLERKRQQQCIPDCEQNIESARQLWKHQLDMFPGQSHGLLSHFYPMFKHNPPRAFLEMNPEIIASYVCRAFTALSIVQYDKEHCSRHLSCDVLPLKSMKPFFQRIVHEWNSKENSSDSYNLFWKKKPLQIDDGTGDRIEHFLQSMGPFTIAACFCESILIQCEVECSCESRNQLDRIHLKSLWPQVFPSWLKKDEKPRLVDLIGKNEYEKAIQLVITTSDHENGWDLELISAIPRLWIIILKHHFQENSFQWDDSVALMRLKCTLKTIQITFENPLCRMNLLGRFSGSSGRCEHDLGIQKNSSDSICKSCNAQRALHHLLIKFSAQIKSHFERMPSKRSHPVDSQQPQHVQYWFQILALLCSQHDLFCRSHNLDSNMDGIDGVSGSNIFFAARKLFELVEVCAAPSLSIGKGSRDGRDIKSCILEQLCPDQRVNSNSDNSSSIGRRFGCDATMSAGSVRSCSSNGSEAPFKLTQQSKDLMTSAVFTELGSLASCSLTQDSSYIAQAEDLLYVLGELMKIARNETTEADARSRILRKVRAWNVSSNTRGCSLYCACLCLMLLGKESSLLALRSKRTEKLKDLQELLGSTSKRSTLDHSNMLVRMFVSELAMHICLSSCRSELLAPEPSALVDEQYLSVTHHTANTSPPKSSKGMILPLDSSMELRMLHQICTAHASAQNDSKRPVDLKTKEEALRDLRLERARQLILSYLTDKYDGQTVEELQVGYKDEKKKLLVEKDGWVDQDVLIDVWNRKWNSMQEQPLRSFLSVLKGHSKLIFQALNTSAQFFNKAATGDTGTNGAEKELKKLSAKDNRLKVSYYQALAEQGDLEPGNPNCKWIRDAFDVEALASQMEETALKNLEKAIE